MLIIVIIAASLLGSMITVGVQLIYTTPLYEGMEDKRPRLLPTWWKRISGKGRENIC